MSSPVDVPFENPNKKVWKQKVFNNANGSAKYSKNDDVNDSLFTDLQTILTAFDDSRDFRPLMQFLLKSNQQLIQAWSLYAQINDHKRVTQSLTKLTAIFSKVNQHSSDCPEQLFDLVGTMVRSILSDYIKTLYRAINNMRGSLTNPTLRMMTEIVSLQKGKYIDEFISHFDFSLPSLVKILVPSKAELSDIELTKSKNYFLTLRYNFIVFLQALIKNAPAILRKDILVENSKLMSNWFKYISKMDNDDLVLKTLDLLMDSIVKESNFKKSTKCKVINEFILLNLHKLYYSPNTAIVSKVNTFFLMYATDPTFSVAYDNEKAWVSESTDTLNTRQGSGAQITIHNKSFRLFNKILFTMLTQFKPWEDDLQCTTVMKVLQKIPEFVSPYSNYLLATHGSHEPKMSSYWFGQTLLLGKIIKLPIPQSVFALDNENLPNVDIVLDNIMPLPLSKISLRKSLVNDVTLIRQMGCQLIVFILQKLDSVLELYNQKGWIEGKAPLLNSLVLRLPDLNDFVSLLGEASTTNKENKLLVLTITMIFNLYAKLFPSNSSITLPSSNVYNDLLTGSQTNDSTLKGIDLVILDNYLEFQQLNDNYKWWNKHKDGNSLFTALVRISSDINTSPTMSLKITNLLQSLVSYTLLFDNKKLLGSPIYALVLSLKSLNLGKQKIPAIWNLLDETVSRCARTPYKYIDSSVPYGCCSAFFIALCEQFSYVEENSDNYTLVGQWICMFARNLVVLGDCLEIKTFLNEKTTIKKEFVDTYLDIFNEQTFLTLSQDKSLLLQQGRDSDFFSFIVASPMSSLKTFSRVPLNVTEISAILFRLNSIISNQEVYLNTQAAKDVIQNLMGKFGQFIFTETDSRAKLSELKIIEPFLIKTEDKDIVVEKKLYALLCLLEIFTQMNIEVEGLNDKLISIFDSYDNFTKKFHKIDIFKAVIEYLPINDIKPIFSIELNEDDMLLLLKKMEKSTEFSPKYDFLVKTALHYKSASVDQIIGYLFKKCTDIDVVDALKIFVPTKSKALLQGLVLRDSKKATEYLSSIDITDSNSDGLLVFIANFIKDLPVSLVETLTKSSFVIFQSNKEELKLVLPFLTQHIDLLTDLQKTDIFEYLLKEHNKKYTSDVAKFVCSSDNYEHPEFSIWLHKCMLYINKHVALIKEEADFGVDFIDFLAEMGLLFSKVNVWKVVTPSVLNSQIEIILSQKWFSAKFLIEYLIKLTISSPVDAIDSNKLFQILLNNEFNPLKKKETSEPVNKYVALLSYILFSKDEDKNSNIATQESILACFNATMAPQDSILFNILQTIESKTSVSWTNSIYAWDFLDNMSKDEMDMLGETKLITKEREGFVITMDKNIIDYTVTNFIVSVPKVPSATSKWSDWESFIGEYDLLNQTVLHNSYDSRFIMLLLLNNKELVQKVTSEEDGSVYTRFDMKKLLKSQLFSLMLISLSSKSEASEIALKIITQMMHCSVTDERLDIVYKVLLKKIVFTFIEAGSRKPFEFCCPLYWYAVTKLCNSLLDARSFLFEKAFRWIFAAPKLRFNDIPLFKQLVETNVHANDAEDYYKYVSWFLDVLEDGIKTVEDIDFIRKTKIIEWLLNLQNSPYVNNRVYFKVNQVIASIQSVYSKAGVLISGFAGLSQLESLKYINSFSLENVGELHNKNQKALRIYKEHLNLQQKSVHQKEIALRYAQVTNSSKRVKEWCDEDDESLVKRVCL